MGRYTATRTIVRLKVIAVKVYCWIEYSKRLNQGMNSAMAFKQVRELVVVKFPGWWEHECMSERRFYQRVHTKVATYKNLELNPTYVKWVDLALKFQEHNGPIPIQHLLAMVGEERRVPWYTYVMVEREQGWIKPGIARSADGRLLQLNTAMKCKFEHLAQPARWSSEKKAIAIEDILKVKFRELFGDPIVGREIFKGDESTAKHLWNEVMGRER